MEPPDPDEPKNKAWELGDGVYSTVIRLPYITAAAA